MHVAAQDRRQVELASLSHLAGLPITNRRRQMLEAVTSQTDLLAWLDRPLSLIAPQ